MTMPPPPPAAAATIFLFFMALIHTHTALSFRCAPSSSLLLRSSIMSKRSSTAKTSQQTKKAKTQQSLSGFFSTAAKKSSSDGAATAATSSSSSSSSSQYKIFCDLDGVLVDFDAGVKKLFNGRSPDQLPVGRMWGAINKADQFYAKLPWTTDGKELWNELKVLDTTPDILTGVPLTKKSRAEKFAWCQKQLGITVNHVDMAGKQSAHELVSGRRKNKLGVVNVITCWSKNKHYESKDNHVLIDDRESLKEAWEGNGGIFIHHTETQRTLSMLRERGILEGKSNGKREE